MTILATRNKPRRNMYKHGGLEPTMTYQNSVMVYRQSPEDILLQIRLTKDYVGISLTFDEAFKLIDALLDALPKEEQLAKVSSYETKARHDGWVTYAEKYPYDALTSGVCHPDGWWAPDWKRAWEGYGDHKDLPRPLTKVKA